MATDIGADIAARLRAAGWIEDSFISMCRNYATSDEGRDVAKSWWPEVIGAWRRGDTGVMLRELVTEWGPVLQLAITRAGGRDPGWAFKQAIKDEIVGPDRAAVEVYPAKSEIVDLNDIYHLWCLPLGFRLPFSLVDT